MALWWQFLARIIAPESLALQLRSYGGDWRLKERARALRPADLILVRTPGAFYSLFRAVSAHEYDHLAVVLEHGLVLHVGPPNLRLLPVELLLDPRRRPMVLRPKLADAEVQHFLQSLLKLIGERYNTLRVYSFIFRLGAFKHLGIKLALPNARQLLGTMHEIFICTDAIIYRLLESSAAWRDRLQGGALPKDYRTLGSWSINDLLVRGERERGRERESAC
jgi:hypothetical protein